MFKGKLQTSLIVLTSIFMSAVSMQAQAWSYGVSWYSDIDFTLAAKGNKLKLANGNFVVSELYAFNYVSLCVATNSGKTTLHSGLGNNGSSRVEIAILEKNSDDRGKDKGTFYAKGTLKLEDMYRHYRLGNTPQCYVAENFSADGSWVPSAPTGDCTDEEDRNSNHGEHFCHAEADQKVEYKDNLYFPNIAVYVRIVEGNEDGTAPADPYVVIEHGIAECEYRGKVTLYDSSTGISLDKDTGEFVTETVNTDEDGGCVVTEYPLSVEDPRFDHILSF